MRRAESAVPMRVHRGSQSASRRADHRSLLPLPARLKLLRYDETGSAFEGTFLVEFQDMVRMHAARKALRALSPEIEITFMDNRGME